MKFFSQFAFSIYVLFFSVTKYITEIKRVEYYVDKEDENCGAFQSCIKRVPICCRDKEEVKVSFFETQF